ncbi:MAG: alpha/beta hydrolase family protein, partial [Acidimicrobiales bacterium]
MKPQRWSRIVASAGALAIAAAVIPAASGARASIHSGFVAPPPAQVTSTSPGATGKGFHATIEHFLVHTGPNRATACSILGEIFVPDGAGPKSAVPVILTTNGFGGSYSDQVPLAELAARHGYAVLTYSGLGFGGSGCNIELDSPVWDGEAASQLVSYLGGLPEVKKDGPDDPRIGMIGGSYGGEVQFAA